MLQNDTILSFLHKATIYEVNTRQFSAKGDFKSVQQQLSRIHRMGAEILWFMPIHPIGKINRKGTLGSYYCSRDFFDVNPEFGTKEDFKNLVAEAHRLGMKVVLDWVANHVAWDNEWAQTHPRYFLRNADGSFVSPYDWSDVIQIDHSNEAAHDAMRSAMLYWVKEFDIDGFRADLAHLTPLRFWIKARQQAEAIKPNLIWLAETEDLSYYEAFDIFYAWKWMHQTEDFVKQQWPVSKLMDLLMEQQQTYPAKALQMYFTTNHDENSWNGTEFEKYGPLAKALAVFSFTYPGSVPLIYCGQEIPNHKRLHFFDKDEFIWPEQLALEDFYATLIHGRKNSLFSQSVQFLNIHEGLLAYQSGDGDHIAYTILHLGKGPIQINIEQSLPLATYRDVLTNRAWKPGSAAILEMSPGDALLLERI